MSILNLFRKDKVLTLTSLLENTNSEIINSADYTFTLFKQSNKHAHFVIELSPMDLSAAELNLYENGEKAKIFTKELRGSLSKNVTLMSKIEIMYQDDLPNELTAKHSVKGKKTIKLFLESEVSDFNKGYIELRKYRIFLLVTIEGYKKLNKDGWSELRNYFGTKDEMKTFCSEAIIKDLLEKGYKRDINRTLLNNFNDYGVGKSKSTGPNRFVSDTKELFCYDMFTEDGSSNISYLADAGGGSSTFAANLITKHLVEGVNVYVADDQFDFKGLNNFFDVNNISNNVSMNPFRKLGKNNEPFFKTYADFIAVLIAEDDINKIQNIEEVVRSVYEEKKEETTLLAILEVLEEDWLISDKIGGYTKKRLFLNNDKMVKLTDGLNLFDSSELEGREKEAFETLFLANVIARESNNLGKFVIIVNKYQGRIDETCEKFYVDLSRVLKKINGALLFLSDIRNESGISIVKESRLVIVSNIEMGCTSCLEKVLDKELRISYSDEVDWLRNDISRLSMFEDPKGNYNPNFLIFENGKLLLRGKLILFSKFKLLVGHSIDIMKRKISEISEDGEIRTEEALVLKILKEE